MTPLNTNDVQPMNVVEANGPLRILHLEDNALDAEMVLDALDEAGIRCEVRRVATRADFESALAGNSIDIIVSDYELSGFDGVMALSIAKKCLPGVPLIFLSGTIGEERAVELLRNGAVDYVLKDRLSRLGPAILRAHREAIEHQQRLQVEEELRERNELFQQITENVDDLIAVINSAGRMIFTSRSYSQLCRQIDPLQRGDAFDPIHEDDRDRVRGVFHDVFHTGTSRRSEYRFRSSSREVRSIDSHFSAIRNAAGLVTNLVAVARDVTERDRLAAEKKELEDQILRTQRLDTIGSLAGGIAHDLNNMLVPILMATELLGEQVTDEETRRILEIARGSALRGSEMVQQILQFARGGKGEMEPLEIGASVDDVAKLMRKTFPGTVKIETLVHNQLPRLMGDATQVHQLLLNLCVNSRDALDQGGVISIEAVQQDLVNRKFAGRAEPVNGSFVELTVRDTGRGIPVNQIPRIFDPFFTTKAPGKGTGLGLSTVATIVRNHTGFIDVSSTVGKGTTIRVYFPAIEPEVAVPLSAEIPARVGAGECVLVVDDEQGLLEMLKELLETHNYHVLTAQNGGEALLQYEANKSEIQAVITDLVMPEMTGQELVSRLLKLSPGLAVICLSASAMELENLSQSGAFATLRKPCSPDQLFSLLNRAFGR
jgi:two-component system cell cycle sensor histidine kinase/response regulator CckA